MKGPIHEIRAARPLGQISSCGRHVAELRGSAAQDCLGDKRIVSADDLVVCYRAVPHAGFDERRSARRHCDLWQIQMSYVDELGRVLDTTFHEINEVCPAAKKRRSFASNSDNGFLW